MQGEGKEYDIRAWCSKESGGELISAGNYNAWRGRFVGRICGQGVEGERAVLEGVFEREMG
jgi:hypothetical protein